MIKKTAPSLLTLLCVTSACATPLVHTVVDERFADRNRNVQSPPESLEWFASVPVNTGIRGTYLHLAARRDGSREVLAHFPSVELAAGQTLIVEFDFHFGIEPVSNEAGFSFGLFDASAHTASRIDTDGYAEGAGASEGYAVLINPHTGDDRTAFALLRRRGKGPLLPQSIARTDRIGPVTQLDAPLYNNRTYHADLRLQRDAGGHLEIHFELSGGGIPGAQIYSFNPAGRGLDRFDTIAFRIARPGVNDVYLSNISIVCETRPGHRLGVAQTASASQRSASLR